MEQLSNTQLKTILQDFVKLSEAVECPNCKQETKLIGETKTFGNWICPFCQTYFPYKDHPSILVGVPFIKLTDELQSKQMLAHPLGDPAPVDFPMNLDTGFL